MLWWDENFIKLLKQCEIVPDVYARFKDDGSIITDKLTKAHTGIYKVLDKKCIDNIVSILVATIQLSYEV